MGAEAAAPIERLQFAALVHAESIGGVTTIEAEGLPECGSLGGSRARGQKNDRGYRVLRYNAREAYGELR